MKRIAIHGVPRSGTTWLGALFDSCPHVRYVSQPLFSYAFKNRLTCESCQVEIVDFFDAVAASDDEFINQILPKSLGLIPKFEKTNCQAIAYKEARYHHLLPHLLAADSQLQAVLIVRNPLSVLASWIQAPKEFDPRRMNVLTEWRDAPAKNGGRIEEFYGFEKWKQFATQAHRLRTEFPDRCWIVNYRDLLTGTERELRTCFDFCELPWHPQTESFIRQSHLEKQANSDVYGVFRSVQSDEKWSEVLPPEIVTAVTEELSGTALACYL